MHRRGFLRSAEGVFPLSPKITIIGRESCDFVIQNITIDNQQAVIEYIENEDCFVLKDLNSTHGTYVNECRIQNASVRLGDGDILKFGFSAGSYEFHIENIDESPQEMPNAISSQYSSVQPSQRLSWQSNPISVTPPGVNNQTVSFPVINYSQPQPVQHRQHNGGGVMSWTQLSKPPASMRTVRPLSASSLNRRQLTPTAPSPNTGSPIYSRKGSISGPTKQTFVDRGGQSNEELKYMQLQAELDRLKPFEAESMEKSRQIEHLIHQNNELNNSVNDSQNLEIYNQLHSLTEEVASKRNEIDQLQKLVAKFSERVHQQNSNTSNNESDINQIRQELEKTRKDLKTSYGLVTTLQKDLGSRDETINKLNRDNENLSHELTEKNVSISVLMNKLSRLKDVQEEETEKRDRERELVGLRNKLFSAETTVQEQNEKIGSLSKSLEMYQQSDKINSEALRDLNKQLDESKSLILDLQRSESILRVDIQEAEKKYDRFRSRVVQVALSTPGYKPSDRPADDDELVDILKDLLKSKVEHDRRICEKQKLLDESNRKFQQMITDIESFTTKLNESYDILDSGERTSSRIHEIEALLKAISTNDVLIPLREIIIKNLSNELLCWSSLESCISDAGPELANLSLSECFKRIIQRSIDAVEGKALIEGKLVETTESYEEKIRRLKEAQQEQFETSKQQLIERERDKYEKKCELVIEEISLEESAKREKLVREFESKISQFEADIEDLKEKLKEKNKQHQESSEKLRNQMSKFDELSKRIVDLEKELKDVSEKKLTLEQSICEQLNTVTLKCKSEIDLYKEESAQHAITIDSLNDRLIKLNNDNMDLKNQITKMKREHKKKKQNDSEPAESKASQAIELANNNATIANLEKCISALRYENVSLKNGISDYEGAVKSLNMDLAGAEARLSDLKGELSESQKNEIDNLKMELQKSEDETTRLRVQLAKFSGIVDLLQRDLDDRKMENTKLNQLLGELKVVIQEKDTRIQDLENQIKLEKDNFTHSINQMEHQGRISNELAVIGSQCRGERHTQIIESQKIALSEMRQKMKILEVTKVPNSTVPEIAQQMLEMKKELAELRSKKALKDSAPEGMKSLVDILALKDKSKKPLLELTDGERNPPDPNAQPKGESLEQKRLLLKLESDLELAKSQQEYLRKCLDFSEMSYLSLLRKVGSVLDMEDIKGLRSFDNLSDDEIDLLKMDREETCGIIVQKLRILKERIQRKEELLQSYEQDLVKLKQAEDLAVKTQSQLENIFQQMRFKGEEVELLRETLNRTKDLLNQEKRTNTAIKKNKQFIPEKPMGDTSPAPTTPKYHCPIPDMLAKEKILEKNKMEKNKRKDYEIKSLKAELYRKEKELSQATNRLYSLETSMGIKNEEPNS